MDFSIINIDYIINTITTLLVIALPFILKIQLAKVEKNQSAMLKNNQKLMDYFQIDMTHDRYIQKLYAIKNHFNFGFSDDNIKFAMNEKANMFIGTIEKILDNYEINIVNLNSIKIEFDTNRNYVKSRLDHYLSKERSDEFRKIHDVTYTQFIIEIEDILASTENHYKEKFINKCCDFMKTFIKELREFHNTNK